MQKTFYAGTSFGSFKALTKAAKSFNAKVVRQRPRSHSVIIHYESIDSLAQIVFKAAQLETELIQSTNSSPLGEAGRGKNNNLTIQ